ncbi:hypothetical protein NKH77_32150 [Streptomyces sp. M19]
MGLPTHDDPLSLVPYGRVDYVPPAFSFAHHLPPSWSYRQTVDVERGAELPEWVAELPTDRPLVFAAIGTAMPMMRERAQDPEKPNPPAEFPDPEVTLRTIAEAVALLDDCAVVVATSGVPWTPPGCRRTSGSSSGCRSRCSLSRSTCSSRTAASTASASRCAPPPAGGPAAVRRPARQRPARGGTRPRAARHRHGAGGIAAVCREVLADRAIAARARQARLAMLALPGVDKAVGDLEKLAR